MSLPQKENNNIMIFIVIFVLIIILTLFFVFFKSNSSPSSQVSSSPSSQVSSPSSQVSSSPSSPIIKRLRTIVPAVTITGFSSNEIISDIKFDSIGNIYVLNIDTSVMPIVTKLKFYQKQNTGLFLNTPTKTIHIQDTCSFLMFDSNDNVFVIGVPGTQKIFYYSNQVFTSGSGTSPQPQIITINIIERSICFDSNDNLIVINRLNNSNSLRFYQKQTAGIPYLNTHTFEITNILIGENSFYDMYTDKNDNVFVLSTSSLYKFDVQSIGNKYVSSQTILTGLIDPYMCIDKDEDNVYIFSNNIFYTYKLQNGTYSIISQFNLPGVSGNMINSFKKFEKDKSGNLIFTIGINNDFLSYSLYYYEKSSNSYKFILPNIYKNDIIDDKNKLIFRFDSKNNLIVLTYSLSGVGNPIIRYYTAT